MNCGLFVLGLIVGEVGTVFVDALGQADGVAVAEDAVHAGNQSALLTVQFAVLDLQILNDCLCDGAAADGLFVGCGLDVCADVSSGCGSHAFS